MESHSNKLRQSLKVILKSEVSDEKSFLTIEGRSYKVILRSEGSHGKTF